MNISKHLRRASVLAAGALASACAMAAPAAPKPPNIVVIMADDMGFSDLGCYGSEIATPNLDRLADNGIRFTQFYNTARCCPSRAALMTGLYPHQAGVGHMVQNRGTPAYQGYLNDGCVTMAEALKPAGYQTLMAGKWHVGEERPHWPTDRGFGRYFGLVSGASSYFAIDAGRAFLEGDQPATVKPGEFYMTDAITDHAVSFLGESDPAKPFFLYTAYTAPHWPLHARPEDIAKYKGKYMGGWDALRRQRHEKMVKLGIADAKHAVPDRDSRVPAWDNVTDKEGEDLKMAIYAAQIDRMDQGIGRILKKIADLGAEDNTLVMFLADNGGCAEVIDRSKPGAVTGTPESYRSYGVGWAGVSNTSLRLHKQRVHEGGISSPLVVRWPGKVAKGAITREVGHLIDLMPTCLEAAGASYPTEYRGKAITPMEGKSLVPSLTGKPSGERGALFWEHQGNRAVRQGKWKLVAQHPQAWELYDIEADRGETRDLAAVESGKAKELAGLHDAWAKRVGVEPWSTGTTKPVRAPK